MRIVAYCVRPQAYQLIAGWCVENGHKLLLVVTSPGPKSRPTETFREVLAAAPRTQEILISTRSQGPVPLIRELQPDLVVSFTFPYRLPPEVIAIPRYGAVNLHPAPLPKYRGPNPLRSIFDGYPVLGSALHWVAPEYDTGNILARVCAALPDDRGMASLMGAWMATMRPALEQGVQRAVAGDPGTPQDESEASYGGIFTMKDRLLDWDRPASLLQGQTTVLTMNTEGLGEGGAACMGVIDGTPYAIERVTPLRGMAPPASPGTVLAEAGGIVTLCCADGIVLVQGAPDQSLRGSP